MRRARLRAALGDALAGGLEPDRLAAMDTPQR
jgi:hypothetical protein